MNASLTSQVTDASLPAPDYAALIASGESFPIASVASVIALLEEGATVPFIARYRKEATGGAEDVTILRIQDRLAFHRELFERRTTVLQTIHDQGKLTMELRKAVLAAKTRAELEDLYLPYRPKRRTRATMAKERGLEPLAERMWAGEDGSGDPTDIADAFVTDDVATADDALAGARDIIAERISETAEWRAEIRDLTWHQGTVSSKVMRGKKADAAKFADYFDFSEPVKRIPSHRVLAIRRGEKEGFLTQRVQPDPDEAKRRLRARVVPGRPSIWREQLELATDDAYDRLLSLQIATDIRLTLKESADEHAIDVFASNVSALLMASPFGARPIIAIDPGFRTGCKVVVLSTTGALIDHGVVYATPPRSDVEGTKRALHRWVDNTPDVGAIAVGNGTGGRETFAVVREFLNERKLDIPAVLVNESGASIYSASEVGRREFPDHDVTVRGAVSIGRRLQDPLAELVKIDPKSIGVGQYQHDVDQKRLQQKLDDVVESCVNRVGVDLNTASASLLRYVAGLSARVADAIVATRDAAGGFASRRDLLTVPGLGAKTFEQAAGFLRVKGSNPLDDSAVHPERYALVTRMAADVGTDVSALIGHPESIAAIDPSRYLDDSVGRFTLDDILAELEKPGRDPRAEFEAVAFRDGVNEIGDLTPGMVLSGVVTNVTQFGAFVDVGVHQDGLVHVSQLADRFVRDPADVVSTGQPVRVKVMDVDLERKRIGLSMKAV